MTLPERSDLRKREAPSMTLLPTPATAPSARVTPADDAAALRSAPVALELVAHRGGAPDGDDEETRTLALLTAWAKMQYPKESWRVPVRRLLILTCEPEDVARQVAKLGQSVPISDRFEAIEGLLKDVKAPWPAAAGGRDTR